MTDMNVQTALRLFDDIIAGMVTTETQYRDEKARRFAYMRAELKKQNVSRTTVEDNMDSRIRRLK